MERCSREAEFIQPCPELFTFIHINREGIMPGGRSTVDESLFANKDSKKSNRGPAAPAAGLVISRGELAKIKQMGVIETYSQKQERAAKAELPVKLKCKRRNYAKNV